ncbi:MULTISPECIES: ABC transporter permease [Empedobacter]|uniref:Inner membrane transport permease ybhR n=1 Tax=Empedobacter falsenii TaxID=343874 RepID=A0A376GG31_9FLAO|nr:MULTISPECIES: ABC transporter permease [Empedobacter]MBW1618546.1 ABC transporter permease [Empedobacter falsenii]STD59161.1 Inner membrane transport permease ybhR [Empedobacter falsenii]
MKNIFHLIIREFKLFFKNPVLPVLFIGAPILYGVLIGNVYKKGSVTNLPIVIVDEDNTTTSQKVIQMIDDNESLKVAEILPSTFNTKDIALKNGADVVLVIPRNFQSDILQQKNPEIVYFVNASNTLTSNTASIAVATVLGTMKAGITIQSLQKKGVPEFAAAQNYEPFKSTMIRQNIRSGNYLYFMLPGVLLTVFQQVLLLGLALSFAQEFETGTFKELVSKASNPFKILFVKTFPYIFMSIFIYLLYYGFGMFYDMKLETEFWPFFTSSLAFILAVCFLGFLVSILLPSQLKATEVLMVVATPSFILSGFTWPLSQMPKWIQAIADCIPLTHYLKIFRILFIEKGDPALIQPHLNNLIVIGSICFVLSLAILIVKIRKAKQSMKQIETEKI